MVLTAEISFCLTFGLLVLPDINFWKWKLLPHLDERLRVRHLDPLDGRKTMSLTMECSRPFQGLSTLEGRLVTYQINDQRCFIDNVVKKVGLG